MDAKLIPGTKGFMASTAGVIYGPDGSKRNTYINGDGYQTASVLLENGKWQTFGVHRLTALAHLPFEGDVNDLTVNHRDGNIKNNHIANLEWLSVGNNNIHAALLRGSKERPVILGIKPDGTYEFIPNLQKAAKLFKCDQSTIWDIILNKQKIDGWELKYHSTRSLIPDELSRRGQFFKNKPSINERPIKVFDIASQEIRYFNSIWEAAKFFNVTSSHVFQCISTPEKKRLFKKRFLIVDQINDFPTLSQDEYETLSAPCGKDVIAYNVKDNKVVIFKSASQFIKENGLSKKAVTVDLKKDRLRLLGDWWYAYLNERNIGRLKSVTNCPEFEIDQKS